VTITPRVINAAREVVIAAAGAEKSSALAAALEGPYDPSGCPIQIVHPADGRFTWLVDRLAAGRLRGRTI
jgi:6-phosphogluconolactonase